VGLDGRVGIVTGAGSGIGKAIAVALAKLGAQVVIADISEAAGQAAVCAVEAIGGKAVFQRTDVSRREDARQLIETMVDQFGRLDILVNNAGLQHVAPIQDFP
jgi:3(or 17)beta-hydroxysteroid dehydrogenase